jgi:hypothetical protein
MKTKKPELPKNMVIPFVAFGLIIAVAQPIVFAIGCFGYLLAEEYLWEQPAHNIG